ncbi:hypothetical protein HAX54_041238 [Datura stramonium]|uniref:ARID domain-containing protein n=1 Tax=Datura stramonium TaxID=4076 RepID=A0ABS8VNS0_DATST|nr:hypothetical protein [Datura stramonium]
MPRLGVLESMLGNKKLKMAKREEPPNYQYLYPPPLASYANIIDSPQLFMDTLKKLHLVLRSKLMIPVIGGKVLDLHRLFVEVTSRGGIEKVLGDKRLDEVALVFSYPSSTNASYLLREYYISLLFHFERVYYLEELFWTPSPHDVLHHVLHPYPGGFALPSPEIEYFKQSKNLPAVKEASTTKKCDPTYPKRKKSG